MTKDIPKGWIPYKPCGVIIEGTRIICFKVPLRPRVQKNVKEIPEIWDVKSVLASIPGLKAVIDLTNTARYYDPQEFERAGVAHKKIMMAGRVIPPDEQVKMFMDAMDSFLEEDEDAVVGVHCTHGLNRTGLMVCRYMRDRLGIPPREAIEKFEKARGYEIRRANYLADILGKPPPPPYFGNSHEDDPIPARKIRSTSLSTFDNIPAEDQNTNPDYDSTYVYDQTDNNYIQRRESRPRKRKGKKREANPSANNIRQRSYSSTCDQGPKKKKRKNDKGKNQPGSRLKNFAFDYKYDY